jgi:hypothetical protein
MAGGITVKQCLCTGKLSIVNSFDRSFFSSSEHKTPCQDQQGFKELSASPCMKIHMESLDDFTSTPSQVHDFAPPYFIVFNVTEQALCGISTTDYRKQKPYYVRKIPIPPRQFLSLKNSLLI